MSETRWAGLPRTIGAVQQIQIEGNRSPQGAQLLCTMQSKDGTEYFFASLDDPAAELWLRLLLNAREKGEKVGVVFERPATGRAGRIIAIATPDD
jgi:hypothetical protein